MLITQVLTKAGNHTLSVLEVFQMIQSSEGKKSDANKASGHPLQHVQMTSTKRKTDYCEKRKWNELDGRGGHSCFKTEMQQAEIVRDILCSNEGKAALRRLNAGEKNVKVQSNAGQGETVVDQGFLDELFGSFCNDKAATGAVVDVHSSGLELHIRSAYPVA